MRIIISEQALGRQSYVPEHSSVDISARRRQQQRQPSAIQDPIPGPSSRLDEQGGNEPRIPASGMDAVIEQLKAFHSGKRLLRKVRRDSTDESRPPGDDADHDSQPPPPAPPPPPPPFPPPPDPNEFRRF